VALFSTSAKSCPISSTQCAPLPGVISAVVNDSVKVAGCEVFIN